jgi:hypothetical protein
MIRRTSQMYHVLAMNCRSLAKNILQRNIILKRMKTPKQLAAAHMGALSPSESPAHSLKLLRVARPGGTFRAIEL